MENTSKKLAIEPIGDGSRTDGLFLLMKGTLTVEILLETNADDCFYFIHFFDPQDNRKCQHQYGTTSSKKGNYVLIEKETQLEIDNDLQYIKTNHLIPEIEKYFKIETRLLEKF